MITSNENNRLSACCNAPVAWSDNPDHRFCSRCGRHYGHPALQLEKLRSDLLALCEELEKEPTYSKRFLAEEVRISSFHAGYRMAASKIRALLDGGKDGK